MKISLGMIVRNEGQTLERCLESVAPFVDEIVIGLAGESKDNTEAIARKYAHKIMKIEWQDDFAYARNVVMNQCSGDYYMWLDGDDELMGTPEIIRPTIEKNPDVDSFHMAYDYGRDAQGNTVSYLIRERIVKLSLGWRWHGRVHEALITDNQPVNYLMEGVWVKHHPGFKNKAGRNLKIMYQELADTEPNPSQRLLMYLGDENAARGNFKEALLHWRRFIARAEWTEESYQVAHKIADVYRETGDFDRAYQADTEAIRIAPHWPDAFFGLAETSYKRGEWQAVVEWTKAGQTKNPPTTSLVINPRDYDYFPLYFLGLSYWQLGYPEEAIRNLSNAYKIRPDRELESSLLKLNSEVNGQKVLQAFMTLYEHLGRHDEWLKARRLFQQAPKILESHPAVMDAWMKTKISTDHVDDPSIMEQFYINNPAWEPMPDADILDPSWLTHPRMAFALSVVDRPGSKVLDVGCSDGFIALPLARVGGHRVHGFDLDPRCIEIANRRAREWRLDAEFFQGTADDVKYGEQYDVAIAFEILEHLVDPGQFLDRLGSYAKKVAITTPYLAWEGGQLPDWDKVEPKGHLRIFDHDDLERLLSTRGRILNLRREPWGHSAWLFAEYLPGEKWTKKAITIVAPSSLEQWGPTKYRKSGLGGSETAAIKLAEAFSGAGHPVTVYNPIDEPGIYNGVTYRSIEQFIPDVHSPVFISWRSPEVADQAPRADTTVLWMHDTDAGDRLTPVRANWFNFIVVLTEWHKKHMMEMYPFIPEWRYLVIPNGVDLERFEEDVTREPHRVIYASSPDRGLDVILEHIWPKVTEAIPDAELHVYYGWDSFNKAASIYPHLHDFRARISNAIAENVRVIQHGRIPQDALAKEFQKSAIWLYPTYFPETYCITAVEAQLAGAIPVTNRLAALAETVRSGITIDGDVRDPAVAERYAEAVIKLLQYHGTEYLEGDVHETVKANAPAHTWREVAKSWLKWVDS